LSLTEALSIQRTDHSIAAPIQHMGIDLSSADILVSKQFLHRPDVITLLQQVGGEGMAKRMTADPFLNTDGYSSLANSTLQDFFIGVVASPFS